VLSRAPWDEVVVGDFVDLAERAGAAGADLVVASSHGRDVADRIGAAHLPLGFPVYDRLGAQLRATAGYRGSLQLLVDAANCLLDHRSGRPTGPGREHAPTRSPAVRSRTYYEELTC
jgi:nitrogenase molybdenum-iron protein NifN